jgi:hypothetical protein
MMLPLFPAGRQEIHSARRIARIAAFMPLQRETESRFEKLERLAGIDVEAA